MNPYPYLTVVVAIMAAALIVIGCCSHRLHAWWRLFAVFHWRDDHLWWLLALGYERSPLGIVTDDFEWEAESLELMVYLLSHRWRICIPVNVKPYITNI